MKSTTLTAAIGLAALVTLAAPAQAQHHHAMQHDHGAAAKAMPGTLIEATVKKVDKAAGKLTLAHGPMENLGMPAMTMAFPVKNAAVLDQFKAGDKVRFRAEQINGIITLVAIEPLK